MKKNANVTVMNVCTPRKTPLAYLDAAKKKIDEDVKLGIFEKVDGISEWCSPMSFVPIPSIQRNYSKDPEHGYWQIELAKESRPYTCFIMGVNKKIFTRAASKNRHGMMILVIL